jgi:predicted GNAT family acetyltransferase
MAPPSKNKPTKERLSEMYEDSGMSTRQIGKLLGVRHITIRRWLSAYGIPIRPSITPNSLKARGITPPTSDELFAMVHVEHLSYQQIADKYGVDFTSVPHWLTKHGIAKPDIWDTRLKGKRPRIPPADELARIYNTGKSLQSIGESFGVAGSTIRSRLVSAGFQIRKDGWKGGKRYVCQDGHEARSVYEMRVDDWLHAHGIAHSLEPHYPWDRRYKADFLVGDTYIEVWGVSDNDAYARRKRMKISRCEDAGIDLVQINHWQFAKGRKWWKPLERLKPSFTQATLRLDAA